MELHASRAGARIGANGQTMTLLEQQRARWDHLLIRRGLAALERAVELGGGDGFYVLQAEISACHARAKVAADTDWTRIAQLYAELGKLGPSPIIELNRAMAIAMAEGPAAGLTIIETLATDPALARYPWLPGARADLLVKLGRFAEAREQFLRAAELTGNDHDRAQLLERAKAL
jgi:predicted RNA polymerase sigma factor